MQKLYLFFKKFAPSKETFLIAFITIIILYPLLLYPYNKIIPLNDVTTYSAWKTFLVESIKNYGYIPLWNPYLFGGAPFLGNSQVAIFYPINILYLIIPVQNAFSYIFLIDYLLMGFFTYKFVRLIGLSKQGAMTAAICMILNGAIMKQLFLGHIIILDSITWFPLLMYLYEKTLLKKSFNYAVISGIVFGLMLLSGNAQIPLYAILATSIYFFIRLFQERKELKKHVFLIFFPLATFGIGLCLAAIQLIPTFEFSLLSARNHGISYDFASAFSLNPKQLGVIIFPSLFGSDINNTYWGIGSFWSSSIYSGIIPFFLACLYLINKKNKYFLSLFVLLIFSFLYSFGKYFFVFKLFYDFVPFFNDFRVPTRFLFLYAFSFSVFVGFGTEYLLTNFEKSKKSAKKLLIVSSLLFTFIGLIYIFLSYYRESAYIFQRYILKNSYAQGMNSSSLISLIQNDLLVFCFFILFALIILVLFYFKRINKKVFFISLILLILIDYFNFYSKFYAIRNTNTIYGFKNEFSYIKKDNDRFRIFIYPSGNEFLTLNEKIENTTGFDPLYLKSYRDFLWEIGPHENTPYESFITINKITNLDNLKLLNVKYIVSKNSLELRGISQVYKDKYYVYKVDNYLPRAYFINTNSLNFNLKTITPSPVRIIDYKPNKITLSLNTKSSGYLVLSENYFPGWQAYDNNKKVNIFASNKIFRSIRLEEGAHNITFIYNPLSFFAGKIITFFTLIMLTFYFALLYRSNLIKIFKTRLK